VERIQFSDVDTDQLFEEAARGKLTEEERSEIRWIYNNFDRVAKTRVAKHSEVHDQQHRLQRSEARKPEWIDGEEIGIGKKLSDENVREIRWLWRHTKLTQEDISDLYDVSATQVSRIVNRKQREDVEGTTAPDFASVTTKSV